MQAPLHARMEGLSRLLDACLLCTVFAAAVALSSAATLRADTIEVEPEGVTGSTVEFRRGDVDTDSVIGLNDVFNLLFFLFLGGDAPACLKAADIDDSGALDVTDPIVLMHALFGLSDPPSEPFLNCGVDPTADSLSCEEFPASCTPF
jgi:hypothetical protein